MITGSTGVQAIQLGGVNINTGYTCWRTLPMPYGSTFPLPGGLFRLEPHFH
jgi:hypothetical protein